jgi:hypothetical protein
MSWLLEQIADVALEERVEVIVVADLVEARHGSRAVNLADLLVRAAHMPGLSLQFLSSSSSASTMPLTAEDSVDLAMVRLSAGAKRVRSMLQTYQRHCGAVLRVNERIVTLSAFGRLPEPSPEPDYIDGRELRRIFATDRAGHDGALKEVAINGLAVSIGSVAPFASIKVDPIGGFVSLLDEIVNLREIEYGIRKPMRSFV